MTSGFKNITVQRYQPELHDSPNGPWGYSGLIEGETSDGTRWIMWLDKKGAPAIFWPNRDEDGAVIGDGIKLDRIPGQFSGVFEQLQVEDDADANGNPEVVTCFPVWHPGIGEGENLPEGAYPPDTMRGIVFAVVPGEGLTPNQRMRKFLGELGEGFGFTTPKSRMDHMRHILDSTGTAEEIVTRLRQSLDGASRYGNDPEVTEAVENLRERKSTQKASDGLPELR